MATTWRTAKSLLRLRDEVNAARPGRDKRSDGTIGDADHQSRRSDHNPWVPPPNGGVVTAMDFTDDKGTLGMQIAEHLRKTRDGRVKYVISEGRMFSSYPTSSYRAWVWRPYSGPNGHFSHTHISVNTNNYDDDRPWGFYNVTEDKLMEELVRGLQEAIRDAGQDPGPVDGVWGDRTQAGLTNALKVSGGGTTDPFLAGMSTELQKVKATPTSMAHVLRWYRKLDEVWDSINPGP